MDEDELPPFYDSIEEYEVNDRNCDLHGLSHCPTCLSGRNDTLSESIGNEKGIENEECNSKEAQESKRTNIHGLGCLI